MTVGTQAAVLASLDVTMFIEFQPPKDSEWGEAYIIPRTLKFFYYIAITSAFCANILVVSQTTMLSLFGSSLALRGPDGSMIVATDGLYEERRSVFLAFGIGLASTVGSVVLVVWLMLSPEAAMVCMSITIFTGFQIYTQYLRVLNIFTFDESETVDFSDIFDGPAAIMAVPTHLRKNRGRKNSRKVIEDDDGYEMNDAAPFIDQIHQRSSNYVNMNGNNEQLRGSIPKPRGQLISPSEVQNRSRTSSIRPKLIPNMPVI